MNITTLLSKFSTFDLKRLLVAKKLHSARAAVERRVELFAGKLGDAKRALAGLDRRIARAIRRRSRNGTPKRRATKARTGSLRSYLAGALKKIRGSSATARELADLALKAGYKTRSNIVVFVRACQQALHVNKEFTKTRDGKYTLR